MRKQDPEWNTYQILERRRNMTKKLMMIDDDPDFVAGIKSILDTAGFEVDVAYNPKDGMKALETKQYDLLLLDIMMGRGAEGIMIARKLRKDAKLRELPVLIITGMREQIAFLFPGEPVHPRFVDVDELVEKPIEPRLLLEKVNSLIQTAEARKAGKK
ncbi:MAG: response regulator [Chloroflexi bacterium]|nr:response regulator [Chloroflexota bacterium]